MPTYTGTIQFFHDFKEQLGKKVIDLSTDTFKMLLVTSAYTLDLTHTILANITNEVSGNGYARQTLGSVAWTETAGTAKFDAADPVFSASGGNWTARRWVIFDDTPTSPADPLICTGLINNADADVTVTDGNTLTFVLNANGLFTLAG